MQIHFCHTEAFALLRDLQLAIDYNFTSLQINIAVKQDFQHIQDTSNSHVLIFDNCMHILLMIHHVHMCTQSKMKFLTK